MESRENTLTAYEKGFLTFEAKPYHGNVLRLLRASVAPETRRAYSSRLKHFFSWCEDDGVPAFPASPEILAAYIAHLADRGAACSTVSQTMAAISAAHKAEGLSSPTDSLLIKKLIKGYRREHGTAPQRKDAATLNIIRALLAVTMLDKSTKAIRDAAIIAPEFAGAFRRSELSAHSLRSGFVTTAIRQGKTERSIMNQTGHRSSQTLRDYFRREDAIEDNAARGLM